MRWIIRPTRLVIIGAVVLTAAVPVLRRELVWQVRLLTQSIRHGRPGCYAEDPMEALAAGTKPAEPEAELKAHPRDVQLRIGLASPLFFGVREGPFASLYHGPQEKTVRRALDEALRLAPDDPVVLSLVALGDIREGKLSYSREEEWGSRRAERREKLPEDWQPELLEPQRIAAPLKALENWAAADLANAAPDAFAAYLLLGAKRDEEALARLEAASRKRYFTLHEYDIVEARFHVLRLRGVPAPAAAFATSLGDPYWDLGSQLRNLARVARGIGWDHYEDGDTETAFRCWVAAGRVGSLIVRHERGPLATRLVGAATTAIGYNPIYRWQRGGGGEDGLTGAWVPNEAHAAFVTAEGEAAAERVHEELSAARSVHRQCKTAIDNSLPLVVLLAVSQGARGMGLFALPLAVIVAVFCLLALWRGRRSPPALSRLWSALLILAAFVAIPAVPLAVAFAGEAGGSDGACAVGSESSGPGAFVFSLPFGLPVLLVALIAIAALWVGRKKGIAYRKALAGALRQTLPTALAVLAAVWVAATAVSVREGGIYAKHATRMWQVGELQVLQELERGK